MKTNEEIQYLYTRLGDLCCAWSEAGYSDMDITSVLLKMGFCFLEQDGMNLEDSFVELAKRFYSEDGTD